MFEQSEAAESSSVTVSVHGPGELIASLPALLGFAPERSVVALAMLRCNDRGDRLRLGPMCRVDLPTSTEQAADLAEALVARLAPSHPAGVQLIVIDDHTHPFNQTDLTDPLDPCGHAVGLGGPPQAGLVEMFAATFAGAGIECRPPMWVARVEPGERWRCYESCACEGELPDPGATTAAATTALAGRVTYRTRDEAAAALAPHPDANSARFRALLDDAHVNAEAARHSDPTTAALEGVAAVRAAIASLAAGGALEETVMARVAVALGDPAVRDVCLGFAAGRDPAIDAAAAEQLWWRLTRAVPAPEVAQPATLLACAVLRRGGGAILSVALERAMRADPSHQLSRLLAQIVAAGVHPEVIEQMVLRASAETETLFGR